MVLLPVSGAITSRRKDVKVELNLGGTVLGRAITVAHNWQQPALPEDKARIFKWCTDEVQHLLSGWRAGIGSSLYKPQKLRQVGGGLDGIEKGLRIMQEGAYGREKLVCRIA